MKKTRTTDAIFENVAAVKVASQESDTLEISMDINAKVNEGDYSRGGKIRTVSEDETPKSWDHDPPPKQKWTPLGIVVVAEGVLSVIFGSRETSDFWVDGLQDW